MTRLTEARWREALATTKSLADFVEAVAALAVQEVERELSASHQRRDELIVENRGLVTENANLHTQLVQANKERKMFELSSEWFAKLCDQRNDEVATLTAQLAEAREKWADADSRNTALRAQLATAKREDDEARHYIWQSGALWASLQVNADLQVIRSNNPFPLPAPAIDPDSGSTCKPDCSRVGYCAPSEGCHATPSGEPRRWTCDKCGQDGTKWEGCSLAECHAIVPVELKRRATPSPEARPETHSTLYKAAHDLYFAGVWTCAGKSEARQVELWEALRDALGLNEGAATAAGVGASPEAREEDEYWMVVRDNAGNIAPYNIRFTPADAKRIGILGGWRDA